MIEVQRATKPLLDIINALIGGFDKYHVDIELQRNLRDVGDHVLRIVERIDAFRSLLQDALTVDATLVGQRQNDEIQRLTQTSLDQNEQVKRISAWAAILFARALVGTIYGMNSSTCPSSAGAGLSARTPGDGCLRSRAVLRLQAPRLALAASDPHVQGSQRMCTTQDLVHQTGRLRAFNLTSAWASRRGHHHGCFDHASQ